MIEINKFQLNDSDDFMNVRQYTINEVEPVNCPSCGSNDYRFIAKERSVIGIVHCKICDLIYVNPRLKSPEKIYWADEKAYYEEAKFIFLGITQHHRDRNYLEDLKVIKKFKPKGNFLDIGTNAGFFLRLARDNEDWNLYGVEPSSSLSSLGRKYFNLNIKNCFLEEAEFKNNFFDIVTMTDVCEHIPNPIVIFKKIRTIMKDDGILFIKVPNGLFNLFKLQLARLTNNLKAYDIFDSYEHLVHYSCDTLTKTLLNNGFSVIYKFMGRPIQTPVWHKYVGRYYQYPTPWILDYYNHILRNCFYYAGLVEYFLFGFKPGRLASNIVVVAKKI